MVAHKRIELNIGNTFLICRPFVIPEGVFDEKRLVSDKEYEDMFKNGKLRRNTVDPKYLS